MTTHPHPAPRLRKWYSCTDTSPLGLHGPFYIELYFYLYLYLYVRTLRYKPDDNGFDSSWCRWKFSLHNPSDRTMALGSTQPLTNMSTRNISRKGKSSWCVGLTTLLPSCADCFEIWQPQPLGTLRACTGIALRLLFSFRLVLGDRVYRQGPLKSNTAYAPEPFGGCKGGGVKGVKGGKRQVEFQNLFQSYFTFMLYLLR